MDSIDEHWIRDAKNGSAEAFERLYRAHVYRIYGLCLRMTGDRDDAEDCTQSAFVNAWRGLDQFRGESGFSTWLYRIAVNEVLALQRRRGASPETGDLQTERVAEAAAPHVALDLEAAIAALPDRARQVFVLRALYGHSHDEVAELLQIAPGTVRAHYFHARDALKSALGKETHDEST